ncbi:MAG TPA: RNase adapter RapZ [Syntrophobacteraceae bacterium]|nr:RNase adapter RapZ [Syntrophobacteraceae bacterium]
MSETKPHVIVVTGLSGSGKSTAIKAFEDIDYFCIDNLPVPLLGSLLELCEKDMPDMRRIALGIDIRERKFLKDYNQIFSALEDAGYIFEIIFLEADNEILQRRYSQTRRVHPAAPSEHQLLQAINFEREQLRALRARATRIIDTGPLSVHELKRLFTRAYSYSAENERLSIQVLSFGYKYGVPLESDLMMDVRFLPNPYFVENLKNLDGSSASVRSWVLKRPEAQQFLSDYCALLLRILPSYVREGKRYLTIAIGCTGGKHRSVVLSEAIADKLKNNDYDVKVLHRDIFLE